MAIAFCNKLSIMEGLEPAYSAEGIDMGSPVCQLPDDDEEVWKYARCDWDANGYRLPTEVEWMWAAMGATKDTREDAFVDGINVTGYTKGYAGSTEAGGAQENLDQYAWHGASKTQPVGKLEPNELGIYDMSGNVSEFCWDWETYLLSMELIDYTGPLYHGNSPDKIRHGGSFGSNPVNLGIQLKSGAGESILI